nr:MAG TPA: tail tube protein [Caudoviricetes sp.]
MPFSSFRSYTLLTGRCSVRVNGRRVAHGNF